MTPFEVEASAARDVAAVEDVAAGVDVAGVEDVAVRVVVAVGARTYDLTSQRSRHYQIQFTKFTLFFITKRLIICRYLAIRNSS